MSEPHEVVRLKRFSQLRKHLVESGIDYLLIPSYNGFKDLLFRAVVVIDVAQGHAGSRGDGARGRAVKALLDEERLGRFLNTAFPVFSLPVVDFWQKAAEVQKNDRLQLSLKVYLLT